MEPLRETPPLPEKPTGTRVRRGLRAIFVERRLPYTVARTIDRLLVQLRMRTKTVRVGGLRLRLRRLTADELVVDRVLRCEDYVRPGYEVAPTDTVVDVGANIGAFAIRAACRASSGRVIAIEPSSENYSLLEHNVRLNLLDNVLPLRAAVWFERQRLVLNVSSSPHLHSVLSAPRDHVATEEVEVVTLPSLFATRKIGRCDLLKLDCEGAEYSILYNLPRECFERIDRIVMEYHASSLESKREEGDKLVGFLEGMGFGIDHYTDHVGFGSGHIFARRSAR
jgi:FkbM family methyltransferase